MYIAEWRFRRKELREKQFLAVSLRFKSNPHPVPSPSPLLDEQIEVTYSLVDSLSSSHSNSFSFPSFIIDLSFSQHVINFPQDSLEPSTDSLPYSTQIRYRRRVQVCETRYCQSSRSLRLVSFPRRSRGSTIRQGSGRLHKEVLGSVQGQRKVLKGAREELELCSM